MFTRIRKIELEIQTMNQSTLEIDHPSRCRPFSSVQDLFFL